MSSPFVVFVTFFLFFLLLSVACFAEQQQQQKEEFVRTPGGGLIPARCVYRVPSGTRIVRREGELGGAEFHLPGGHVREVGKCKVPLRSEAAPLPPSGWQVYTYWVGPKNITSFVGFWNVPDNPPLPSGQLLYLFTGLQNNCGGYGACPDNATQTLSATTNILQPVLQYGSSPAGGGDFWGIASWYVADFGTAHTDVSEVAPNDRLYGSMIKTSAPNGWQVYFNDTTNSTVPSTLLSVSNALTSFEPDAYVTLEVYGVTSCRQYPSAPVEFTQMAITAGDNVPVTPKWLVNTYSSACQESVKIVSPSAVTITW